MQTSKLGVSVRGLGGLALALSLGAAAAQAMPFVYKRFLNMFEGDYVRLKGDFEGFKAADKPRLEGYLVRLQNHLKKIPASFHGEAEFAASQAKFDALKAKLEGGAAPAAPAPAAAAAAPAAPAPAPAKPAAAPGGKTDLEMARLFQSKYQALSNELRAVPSSAFADASKVAGWRARLAELKGIVDGYRDMSKPWAKQTKASYDSYSTWFEGAVAKAGGPTGGAAATSSGSAPAELDFNTKRVLGFFDKDHDRYQQNLAGADQATVKGYVERLENRLASVPANYKAHAEVKARAAKVEAFKAKLAQLEAAAQANMSDAEKARAAAAASAGVPAELDYQTKRQIMFYDRKRSAYDRDFEDLSKTDAAKLMGYVDTLEENLGKVNAAFQGHPDVVQRRNELAAIRKRIEGEGAAQAKMAEEIVEQMALLKGLFPFPRFSADLTGDTSTEGVRQWAAKLKSWSQSAKDGKAFLEEASKLPKMKKDQDFKQYKTWFPQVQKRIDDAVEEAEKKWKRNLRGALMQTGVKPDAMSEAQARSFAARLQGVLPDFDRLQAFQQAYYGKFDPEWDGKRGELEDTIARLLGSANSRLDRARLPEATVEQKPELLQQAEEVLSNPKYELGPRRALRVTTHPKRETRTEYFDGTWYTKDWDEYQVAFAHQDPKKGGKWFVAFGTLKYFRKAWRTTPQNKWILGDFWNSEQIKEENIR